MKPKGWSYGVEHGPSMGWDWRPLHAEALQGLHLPPGQHQHDFQRISQFFALQVMEDGRPFLDMAHVITSLNRLDAGIPDKVLLRLIFAQNRHLPWRTLFLTETVSLTRSSSISFLQRTDIILLFRSVWCQGTNSMSWWWAMLSSKTAWNRWNQRDEPLFWIL